MHPKIIATMGANHGLITRQQALDHGLTPSRIAALVRVGEWVAVRRGVYATGEHWASLDVYRGRPRLVSRAAVATMQRGYVLSHDSAAFELGIDLPRPGTQYTHITRPGYSSAWTRYGVKHHYARFADHQVVDVEGMRVLDLARTAVDVGREHGFEAGVVAADAALRLGATRSDLIEAYLPMTHWPYTVRVKDAVDFADAGAANLAESYGRILVAEAIDGEAETQFPVATSGGVFWSDIRVGPQTFEVDGFLKGVPVAEGGVATKPPAQVAWEEKKRERCILERPLGVSRIIWEDFFGEARVRARARLLTDYQRTVARYGPELCAELQREAREIRARYLGPGRPRY